jgi:hypothetical protein
MASLFCPWWQKCSKSHASNFLLTKESIHALFALAFTNSLNKWMM